MPITSRFTGPWCRIALVACVAVAARVDGQTAIPVRQLAHVLRSDSSVLMGVASVRPLPNGSVIVNDATRRQLVVFDSTLAHYRVIADTSTKSENSYGLRGSMGGLVPYVGDSTIFVDTESNAFLVINPRGEFARIMAPVRAYDMSYISSGGYGAAGFDPKGRLIYRSQRRAPFNPNRPDSPGKPVITLMPDSAPLMRMDFDKRTVDTIGMIKSPVQKYVTVSTQNSSTMYSAVNPLPVSDEWALLPDGTIAIVRNQDYHIDWLAPDGKLTSSPKMPFDWKRITQQDKEQMIDSLKKENAAREAKLPPQPPQPPGSFVMPRMVFTTVEPSDLPDFYPAVRQGQVRADPAGNVWILPSTSSAAKGGLLYDVVNRQGEIFERVQLPPGRTLVGFGAGNVIYMNNVVSPTKAILERAEVVHPVTP